MALTQITDFVARARARVLKQYSSLTTRFLPLMDVYIGEAQELEDAVWGFVATFDLANTTDIWLDRLGAIVGEARESENDTIFRLFIQARVLANKSNGTIEEVIAVFQKMINDTGAVLTIRDCQPASIEIIVTNYIFRQNAGGLRLISRMRRTLAKTRLAGVKLMVIGEPSDPTTSFKFSSTGALVANARGFADANNLATPAGHFRIAFLG